MAKIVKGTHTILQITVKCIAVNARRITKKGAHPQNENRINQTRIYTDMEFYGKEPERKLYSINTTRTSKLFMK